VAYPTLEQVQAFQSGSGTSVQLDLPVTGEAADDVFLIFLATDGDNSVSNWSATVHIRRR
jgi:hypothetical protein